MRLLFLSNGHGEDVIASRLAAGLKRELPAADLVAFPLVGNGAAWRNAGMPVAGEARALPSGGLTFHSPGHLLADLRAGLVGVTLRQFRDLRRQRPDAVIVVGDVWALALAMLIRLPRERRFALQTLISVRQQRQGGPVAPGRLFMERITALERLLQRRGTAQVWLRDRETADWLRERLVPQAAYAGSFITDAAPGTGGSAVLLLPGSRAWAGQSLSILLRMASLAPRLDYELAWAQPAPPEALPVGWRLADGGTLTDGTARVTVRHGELPFQLTRSRAAVGTAGTAVEQAAAAGLPVLSYELPGLHTAAFLANQERLLHGALHVAESAEPELLAARLEGLLADGAALETARKVGLGLAGEPGGLGRIAAEIAARLSVG